MKVTKLFSALGCAVVLACTASASMAADRTVGVSLLNKSHVFYNNIETAILQRAEELGIDIISQDASGDANKQMGQVQDFITQGVDAIILCPTNTAGSKSMIELAAKSDIPVFTMDIESDGAAVSHVATDNYKGGALAAQYVAEKVLPGKKGNVVVITYAEIESCVQREEGFTQWLAENAPDIKVVDIQNYSGDQQKAADVMQNMLLKHEHLDAVFCVGDPAAIGALSSISAAGKDITIIGFDGNPEGIQAIKSGGVWKADVAQDPAAIGTTTLNVLNDYLDGKEVQPKYPISPYIIDASTL